MEQACVPRKWKNQNKGWLIAPPIIRKMKLTIVPQPKLMVPNCNNFTPKTFPTNCPAKKPAIAIRISTKIEKMFPPVIKL